MAVFYDSVGCLMIQYCNGGSGRRLDSLIGTGIRSNCMFLLNYAHLWRTLSPFSEVFEP